MKLIPVALFFIPLLGGCLSGNFSQSSPTVLKQSAATRTVNAPIKEVWSRFVPELSKSFYVVNNMDKESGFINVSYSGDPERYVDGGTVTSWVKNMSGRREYTFPATSKYQEYEHAEGGYLYSTTRNVQLDGRINITMMEVEPNKTIVTVNARYILRKFGQATRIYYDPNRYSSMTQTIPFDISVSFSSGDDGVSFAGQPGVYRPTGELEREILALLGTNEGPPSKVSSTP